MSDEKKIGMGCPPDASSSSGGAGNIGDGSWRSAPIERVAEWSPVIALARAHRVQFAPWLLNIRGTFLDSTTSILPVQTWTVGTEPERLAQTVIVDNMVVQITQPNAFAGNLGKSQSDYYFQFVSGIESTLIVDGQPKYVPAPDFTPISSLAMLLGEAWPMGWVLGPSQAVKMQMTQTIPLPSAPTKVVVTFRTWTMVGVNDYFFNMTDGEASRQLRGMGYRCPETTLCRGDRPLGGS